VNALRIFKRLRSLENGMRERKTAIGALGLAIELLAPYRVVRTMLRALSARIDDIEDRAPSSRPLICARCGGMFDNTKRDNGPKVMERETDGKKSFVIACYGCEPYIKRNGWIVSKPGIRGQEGATA